MGGMTNCHSDNLFSFVLARSLDYQLSLRVAWMSSDDDDAFAEAADCVYSSTNRHRSLMHASGDTVLEISSGTP